MHPTMGTLLIRRFCVLQGVTVRALILLNPQNPLGDIYSPSELRDYLEFAKRYVTSEG